jgi:Putative prokaryotic signal transducing protein
MSEVTLVVVHSFGSGPDAEMAKSALEAAGIDAMIQADAAGGMRPHLAWASGGFKILVREEDAASAREVLEGPSDALHDGGR